MGAWVQEFVRFGPHAGAHRVAVRCAVSTGIQMLVLLVLDRLDLVGAAAFGAFAAVFARELAGPARTRVQAITGAGLSVSVIIGLVAAHLPGRPWSSIVVVSGVAVVATIVGGVVRWKPAGPLFFVFASGAFAGAPALAWAGAVQVAGTAVLSAAFAVVVGRAGSVVRHWRGKKVPARPGAPAPAIERRSWGDAIRSETVLDVLIACASAGVIAAGAGLHHVYWAVLSASVPASVTLRGPWLTRGLLRVTGTIAGIAVAAPLLMLALPAWVVVFSAIALQLATEMFVQRNYGFAMLFITPLALLVSDAARPGPVGGLLGDRFWGTVVGIGAGLAVLGVRAMRMRRRPRTALG